MISARVGVLSLFVLNLAIPHQVSADSYVIPSGAAGTDANDSFTIPLNSPARTYQMQIAASELAGISVGDSITGLRWRLDQSASPPIFDTTFSSYQIQIGAAANAIGSMSTTFADNFSSPTTVYNGSLTIASDFFSAGSNPNAFSQVLSFTTAHTYTGGDLVILIRHGGNGVGGYTMDSANSLSVGYNSAFRALRANAIDATVATFTTEEFAVTQLEVTPVPEAEWAALGTGLVLAGWAAQRSWKRRAAGA